MNMALTTVTKHPILVEQICSAVCVENPRTADATTSLSFATRWHQGSVTEQISRALKWAISFQSKVRLLGRFFVF